MKLTFKTEVKVWKWLNIIISTPYNVILMQIKDKAFRWKHTKQNNKAILHKTKIISELNAVKLTFLEFS